MKKKLKMITRQTWELKRLQKLKATKVYQRKGLVDRLKTIGGEQRSKQARGTSFGRNGGGQNDRRTLYGLSGLKRPRQIRGDCKKGTPTIEINCRRTGNTLKG